MKTYKKTTIIHYNEIYKNHLIISFNHLIIFFTLFITYVLLRTTYAKIRTIHTRLYITTLLYTTLSHTGIKRLKRNTTTTSIKTFLFVVGTFIYFITIRPTNSNTTHDRIYYYDIIISNPSLTSSDFFWFFVSTGFT